MEIKKTLLWVVFSVSGIMLFNNWQIAHGNKPLPFLAPPTQTNSSPTSNEKVTESTAQLPNTPSLSQAQNNISGIAPKNTLSQEVFKTTHLQNNVLDLEISAKGGTITKSSLKKHLDKGDKGDPVVLMENKPNHTYLARSGLISAGLDVPNHNDVFSQKVSADGTSLIQIAEKNGVIYEKTYTLKPDSYVLEVKHSVTNKNNNPVSATIYAELVRDGTSIDESQFYSTFTGPALFTEKEKFKEVAFKDIENNKIAPPAPLGSEESGWIAIVQHYFASAWIPEINTKREFYYDKLDKNLYRIGMTSSLETIAPGSTQSQTAQLFIGPDDEKILKPI